MQDLRATYSPEDNKLRLYPVSRLPKDLYDQVKAAGFKWAPKQELFVAPMWTPEREDLLLHLCDEVEDEDTSLVARAEGRAERFEDYSANRAEDAERARVAVSAIADNIPLGQPILVGHHSEARARRDAEKIQNGMARAVKMWDQSKYWQERAQGAIRAAKYKERPDVRARRIKTLEADKRKQERTVAQLEKSLRFWTGKFKLKNTATGESIPFEITEANKARILKLLGVDPDLAYLPCVREADSSQTWDAYDVLKPDGERYGKCPSWTVGEVQARALEYYPQQMQRHNRWIAHYGNRIAYEQAMLAEDGGTATDRKGPEVGGGVKCWASHRGGFSWVVKINKVSVTVYDNWGNGGANFTRNIPFDKISRVVSLAEVEAKRAAGMLREYTDKTGFFMDDSAPISIPPKPAEPEPERKKEFEALRESLAAGVQVVSAPQLFPTPPALVERMLAWLEIEPGHAVLEPSAGMGNIADAIRREHPMAHLDCVEINPQLCRALEAKGHDVWRGDFLTTCRPFCPNSEKGHDRIAMNPPFADGQDIAHIRHAYGMLVDGGRLAAICSEGVMFRQDAKYLEFRAWLDDVGAEIEDIPAGAFEKSGTGVKTRMLFIVK